MKLPNIAALVRGQAKFLHYQSGELWYRVDYTVSHQDGVLTTGYFDFPVPISDTGDGIFLPADKGLFFMRWIRKHLELIKKGMTDEE